MNEAAKLSEDSPAYATAQYHRIRLLMESGEENNARTALDEMLPGLRSSLQNSSLNLFLAQRMRVARNFEEFLEFAPRIPEEIAYARNPKDAAPLFDADSIAIFNRALPLSCLARAALSARLPLELRRQLLRAAWVKAALISDDTATKLGQDLERMFPEVTSDLESWRAARDADSRQFGLAMLMLHFPGMSPYLQVGVALREGPEALDGISDYRENWWCGFDIGGDLDLPTANRYEASRYGNRQQPPKTAPSPAFLTASEKAEFMLEWQKLAAVPTAPNYFGKIVLAWAAKHPDDARVPEALHLVVKSTRFGCTDAGSGGYSQSAFRLLHSKYPDTTWAKLTPYWYR